MVLKYDFSTLRIARSYEREHPSNPINNPKAVSMVRVRVSAVCLARAAPVLCRRSEDTGAVSLLRRPWSCVHGASTLVGLSLWCEDTGAVSMVRVH